MDMCPVHRNYRQSTIKNKIITNGSHLPPAMSWEHDRETLEWCQKTSDLLLVLKERDFALTATERNRSSSQSKTYAQAGKRFRSRFNGPQGERLCFACYRKKQDLKPKAIDWLELLFLSVAVKAKSLSLRTVLNLFPAWAQALDVQCCNMAVSWSDLSRDAATTTKALSAV